MKHHISRIMSTQHPDNVRPPFFSDTSVIAGDDEIKEAFYVYSHIGCKEQLWDCEGKEVDTYVVKKLLSRYEQYFQKTRIGKDVYLTYRVPNPSIEKNEAKILLETLESIPRSHDIAKLFYGENLSPIFEVCLPMTSNHKELLRIGEYYKQFVIGKQTRELIKNDLTIAQWIGEFKPEELRVTPLIEDMNSMLNADKIVRQYIESAKIKDYQRVWLARSDPALNYGNLAAVLIEKVALQRLYSLEKDIGLDILPILGCGSAPFRGNLKPTNVKSMLRGYPSVHTFTIQSAFKYDYPESSVRKGIEELNESSRKKPIAVDEKICMDIIRKTSKEYRAQIKLLADTINDFTRFIPSRRKRKLHIGLFGYSRASVGIKLPRAIPFCASLYSLGLPPELLGLNAVSQKELEYISTIYPGFEQDLKDSLRYLNKDNLKFFSPELIKKLKSLFNLVDYEPDEKHNKVTSIILNDFKKLDTKAIEENICRAGWLRGFLG